MKEKHTSEKSRRRARNENKKPLKTIEAPNQFRELVVLIAICCLFLLFFYYLFFVNFGVQTNYKTIRDLI